MSINQVAPSDAVNLASQNSMRQSTEVATSQPLSTSPPPKEDSQREASERTTVNISDAARAAQQAAEAKDAQANRDASNGDRQAQDAAAKAAALHVAK